MSDFNFVGGTYIASSITQDDQDCINWYCETDPTKKTGYGPMMGLTTMEEERGGIALNPTPGLLLKNETMVAAEVRCLYVLPGGATMLAVSGNTLYSVNSAFVATAVGTLATSAGHVWITDNDVTAYITDGGGSRYTYTWGTNTFATVSDGAFTGGGTCGTVDNFMFYNRPGFNQWGCTNVGDSVSAALNLGSMIGSPGNLSGVYADHQQVLLMGEYYSERHVDVGTYPFPFALIPGSAMQHGTTAPASVSRFGEAFAFLANDQRGQATVAMWGAALPNPQRISTFAVEQAIQSYAVTNDAIGMTYTQSGHEFYMLTFPTADVTWCYDLASGLWHKRAWRDPASGIYHRHRANCLASFQGEIVVGDYANGKLYAFSQSTYTDNGDPLPCVRRCRHLTSDLKRQFFSDLQIQFQPGVGLVSGQGSDPECILRWSNDGGFTWGNDHILKIGKAGEYRRRAIRRRLGWARDRVYEVVLTDPVYRVVVSANLNYSAGSN